MNVTSHLTKITLSAMAAILGAFGANATPITIPNASFETPTSPTQTSTNPNIVTGWVFNVKGGSAYGTSSISSNFSLAGASLGNEYAFINNDDPNVTDTLTSAASLAKIAPETKYTLTLAIGNHNGTGLYHDPGNVSFSLLANGVPFATQTVNNGTVPNGTFEDFTLTYTTPSSGSLIGENLTIQLAALPEQSNAFQPAFDNVTLDATSVAVVPEPPTAALLVSGGFALFWLMRRRRVGGTICAALILSFAGLSSANAQAIKTLPLDDQTVYRLKVGTDKVTTLVFPQPITALEGSEITADPKTRAKILLSYHAGDRFFSVRALADPAAANLNVIINRKVYVIELVTDKEPFQSVTFYPADEPPAQSAGQPNVGPSRLLGLLDKAKAYPLLAEQYTDPNEPTSLPLGPGEMATADPAQQHTTLTAELEQRLKQEDQLLQTTYEQNERLAQEIKTLQDEQPHVRLPVPNPQPAQQSSVATPESQPKANSSASPQNLNSSQPTNRTWSQWFQSVWSKPTPPSNPNGK